MKIRFCFVSNSSSSSFICDTPKTKKTVTSELKLIIELYNIITKENLSFNKVFAKPYYGSKEYTDWLNDGWDANVSTKGKVIVDSAKDNSVPWAIVEFIESVFNAERIHLG